MELAGWLYRIGPKQTCTLPGPAKEGGQYLMVASGAMVSRGAEYARHSVAYISPEKLLFRCCGCDGTRFTNRIASVRELA